MQNNERKDKDNLLNEIDKKGFDFDKIAEMIGVSRKLLHKKLRNKGELRLDEAIRLVDALGMKGDEVDEFLFPKYCETLKKDGDCL